MAQRVRDHQRHRQAVGGRVGERAFFVEHSELPRVAALSAVFDGPSCADPAARRERSVESPIVHGSRSVHALAQLVGEVLREEGAHLGTEGLGVRGEVEIHARTTS